jgi:hypothetical protein
MKAPQRARAISAFHAAREIDPRQGFELPKIHWIET